MTSKELTGGLHMFHTKPMPLIYTTDSKKEPSAAKRLETVCRDAQIAAKTDRLMELIQRIPDMRNRPIPDYPGAGPSAFDLMFTPQPSAGELAAQRRAQDWDRICAEAADAYAARNPHKKEYRG